MSKSTCLQGRTARTPGPWSVPHFALSDEYWESVGNESKQSGMGTDSRKKRCDCRYVLCESVMGAVCTVHVADNKPISEGGNDDPPIDEAKANAHLIAAAPDLLEALSEAVLQIEYLHEKFQETGTGNAAIAKARAAIAKATNAH
jgi:hypothetical protein